MSHDPDVRRSPARWVRRLRPRRTLVRMWARVQRHAPSLVLAAAAAGLAYLLAVLLFGREHAFFAPVAAIVSVGLSAGQRVRRAAELSAGVVLGLLAADLLSRWLGAGPWQLTLAVLLSMTTAVAFRASGLMANQAAVAAVVVMGLVPFQDVGPFVRLGDALVGGLVAVALNAFLAPDPYRAATGAAEQVLDDIGTALHRMVPALRSGALSAAESSLKELLSLGDARGEIEDAMAATRERIRLGRAPRRMEQRRRLRAVEQLADRLDLMLTSCRSMARAAASVVRHGDVPDERLVTAVEELIEAVAELRRWILGQSRADRVRALALQAAGTASATLSSAQPPTSNVLVWQIRSAAVDMLRVVGLSHRDAVRALEAAAGRADPQGRQPAPILDDEG